MCVALRTTLRSPNPLADETARQALTTSVERVLFSMAALAPPATLVDQALDAIAADPDLGAYADEQLAQQWRLEVTQAAVRFRNDPDRWVDARTRTFLEDCSITSGVDLALVPRLILEFHSLGRAERMGVSRMIERSSAFGFLQRELAEGGRDLESSDPDTAFRKLIRATFRVE